MVCLPKDTQRWAKRIILSALAYFISPIDMIPDLSPFLGFTDDLGVLGIGLVAIAAYVNDDVRKNARERLDKWFKNYIFLHFKFSILEKE